MNAMQISFQHWMDHHTDSPPVKEAWIDLEQAGKEIPAGFRKEAEQRFRRYLQRLEYQAFCGGYVMALRMSAECYAESVK